MFTKKLFIISQEQFMLKFEYFCTNHLFLIISYGNFAKNELNKIWNVSIIKPAICQK